MQLGAWTPYLDEPAMLSWYALPTDVQVELSGYHPDGHELRAFSPARFRALHQAAIAYANNSVDDLPAHGREHFEQVEAAGGAAVAAIERLRGEVVPLAVKQALMLALRLHDCHHSGSTLRADAPPARLYRPELGLRVTHEWVSAQATNEFSRRFGLPLPARLFQIMVIWSSTYGGETVRGHQWGVPVVKPQGLWGRLMRAADVCPPPTLEAWLAGARRLLYGEVPIEVPPANLAGFLALQQQFGHYIEHCFDELDEAARVPVTRELGWRDNLARLQRELQAVLAMS